MTSIACAMPGSIELEKVPPVWSEMVCPSTTYWLWLWKPWKWKRPFSSLANPGVAVINSSIALEAVVAGGRARYRFWISRGWGGGFGSELGAASPATLGGPGAGGIFQRTVP